MLFWITVVVSAFSMPYSIKKILKKFPDIFREKEFGRVEIQRKNICENEPVTGTLKKDIVWRKRFVVVCRKCGLKIRKFCHGTSMTRSYASRNGAVSIAMSHCFI